MLGFGSHDAAQGSLAGRSVLITLFDDFDLKPELYPAAAKTGDVLELDGVSPANSQAFMKAMFDSMRDDNAASGARPITRLQVQIPLVDQGRRSACLRSPSRICAG